MTTTSVLAAGLTFGEGPRWHDGRLWFSDFFDQAVKTCTAEGHVEVAVSTPQRPSGLGWLPDGRMLIVSMQDRRILRREPDGSLVTHADLGAIATWHCNDMVVDAHGRAYVGNFGFDLEAAMQDQTVDDLIAHHPTATLARVDPDGAVHVAALDMHFPNGSVITPDGSTLIVGETLGFCLTAFTIEAGGALTHRRTWAPLGPRTADGICLDADGQVWVANPFGPEVFRVAEGGEVTATIATTQNCYACMLGGDDGRTLFCLTARTAQEGEAESSRSGRIEVARVAVPHAGMP